MPHISQNMLRRRLVEHLDDAGVSLREDGADYSQMDLESIPENDNFVVEAFRRILGRPPELDALDHYVRVLRSHPRSKVLDTLLAARDGVKKATPIPASEPPDSVVNTGSNLSNDSPVDLGRASELAHNLDSPTASSRDDGAGYSQMDLESIPENENFVAEAFRRILGRTPEWGALQHYVGVLRSQPRSMVLESLIAARDDGAMETPPAAAAEPADSVVNTGSDLEIDSPVDLTDLSRIENHGQCVSEMYWRVLGRASDLDGFVHYRDMLSCGVPKIEVLALVAGSPEAAGRRVRFIWRGSPLPAPAPLSFKYRLRLLARRYFGNRQSDAAEHTLFTIVRETMNITGHQRQIMAELKSAVLERALIPPEITRIHKAIDALSGRSDAALSGLTQVQQRTAAVERQLETLGAIATTLAALHERLQQNSLAAGAALSAHQPALSQKLDAIGHEMHARQNGLHRSIDRSLQEFKVFAGEFQVREAALGAAIDICRQRLDAITEDDQVRQSELRLSIDGGLQKLDAIAGDIELRQDALLRSIDSCRAELGNCFHSMLAGQAAIERSIRPPVLMGPDILITKVDDFVLAISNEDWCLAAYYAFWGTVDKGLTRCLKSILRPGMVFIDVGANVGMHTLQAARAVGQTGKVYSFEPDPRTFGILKQNVTANALKCVELYQAAVLDTKAEVPLYRSSGFSGMNALFTEGNNGNSVLVSGITLDEALENAGRIDIIKMDAEGAEPAIFRGMVRILDSNPEVRILMEFSPEHLRRAGVSPAEFLDSLYAKGFGIERVDELTGELSAVQPGQLLSAYSENLSLQRTVK